MSLVPRQVLFVLLAAVGALLGAVSASASVAGYSYDDTPHQVHHGYDHAVNLAAGAVEGNAAERHRLWPVHRVVGGSLASSGEFSAPNTTRGLVDLTSAARRRHILDGDVLPGGRYSGGHRAGTGFPGKSEFPASWSDDQIMHHISDTATDPTLRWQPGRGGDFWVRGTREGVDIEVLIRNDEIWTAYPTNVPRNP